MNKTLAKKALLTGLLMSMAVFLFFLVLRLVGEMPFGRYEFMYFPIYVVVLFWGMWKHKQEQDKKLSGVEAITFGLLANFMTSVGIALWLYAWIRINPVLLADYAEALSSYLTQAGQAAPEHYTPEFVSSALEDIKEISAHSLALDKASKLWIVGMVLQTIVALFVKNR
jgi:hypothetical protein